MTSGSGLSIQTRQLSGRIEIFLSHHEYQCSPSEFAKRLFIYDFTTRARRLRTKDTRTVSPTAARPISCLKKTKLLYCRDTFDSAFCSTKRVLFEEDFPRTPARDAGTVVRHNGGLLWEMISSRCSDRESATRMRSFEASGIKTTRVQGQRTISVCMKTLSSPP